MRVPWTARRSNQSILKENSPEYSLELLMLKLKLQYFGHLMRRTDSLEKTLMLGKIEDGRRRGRQRMRWLDGITDSVHESEQASGDGGGQGSLVSCSSRGRKESDTTEQLNNSNHLYVKSKKQMNQHNKTDTESQIQRTNSWLPRGRGWEMREIHEGEEGNELSVTK